MHTILEDKNHLLKLHEKQKKDNITDTSPVLKPKL